MLYYESHITIEPILDETKLELVKQIAHTYHFKVADLLMKKREEDTAERSQYDTFMTGHSRFDKDDLSARTIKLINHLQSENIKVWRYKIEDVSIDSRINDIFNLGVAKS